MADPNLVYSGLNGTFILEGHRFEVFIIRLEGETPWTLEVVDEEGTSTVWDDEFESDTVAYEILQDAIKKEGLSAFKDDSNIVKFPS